MSARTYPTPARPGPAPKPIEDAESVGPARPTLRRRRRRHCRRLRCRLQSKSPGRRATRPHPIPAPAAVSRRVPPAPTRRPPPPRRPRQRRRPPRRPNSPPSAGGRAAQTAAEARRKSPAAGPVRTAGAESVRAGAAGERLSGHAAGQRREPRGGRLGRDTVRARGADVAAHRGGARGRCGGLVVRGLRQARVVMDVAEDGGEVPRWQCRKACPEGRAAKARASAGARRAVRTWWRLQDGRRICRADLLGRPGWQRICDDSG